MISLGKKIKCKGFFCRRRFLSTCVGVDRDRAYIIASFSFSWPTNAGPGEGRDFVVIIDDELISFRIVLIFCFSEIVRERLCLLRGLDQGYEVG
jgi:hypothetical protein